MVIPIRLPDMGTNVEECKVLLWKLKVGDTVVRGEVLAEIETDKATADLESTTDGVLLRQVVGAGGMARTGDILGYIGQPGEEMAGADVPAGATSARQPTENRFNAQASPRREAGRPVVSFIARNLATKLGVNLATVVGTGPGAIITRQDLLGGVRNESPISESPFGARLTRNQTAVARAVLRSWREIPHFYVAATIDMTAAQQFREKARETGACPSYDAIFLKAMGRALDSYRQFRSGIEGDMLQSSTGSHIALAVGTQTELFLPVLRDVNKKTLNTIQAEIAALSSKAATGAFSSDDLTGGCIGLSNLGMYDIEEFEAIIFPGHSAVLAVGSVQERPVAVDHHVEVRPLVNIRLAADHRLVNGQAAAEFLCTIKHSIETGNFA